jgi:hypothetical protein
MEHTIDMYQKVAKFFGRGRCTLFIDLSQIASCVVVVDETVRMMIQHYFPDTWNAMEFLHSNPKLFPDIVYYPSLLGCSAVEFPELYDKIPKLPLE